MKATTAILLAFLFASILISCEKEEGPGGTSTIVGQIWVQNYSRNLNMDITDGAYWGEEVDVYLIYGNDSIYSDRTKTNYDGSYWFQYLHEGTYTVYAYSDTAYVVSLSGKIVKKQTITISSAGSTVKVPTITLRD
ncbi:MAG: hypothetical protein PF517_06940 [Salinivirgaceae bacterium]|nr:hypothetical protein [Salinivirgaceae bacterium]